jgi:ankyrin repeat protein
MQSLKECIASALRDLHSAEWNYLHNEMIPSLEVKGFKLAKPIELMRLGERGGDVLFSGLDDQEREIVGDILDMLCSPDPIPMVSLFAWAICDAIDKNDETRLLELLNMQFPVNRVCPNLSTSTGGSGVTSLHYATQRATENIVSLLLLHGGDPSIVNDDGESGLSMAVARSLFPIALLMVKTLLALPNAHCDLNAALNYISASGNHPLDRVFFEKDDAAAEFVDFISSNGFRLDASQLPEDSLSALAGNVIHCIESDNLSRLRRFLALGYPVNSPLSRLKTASGSGGITALHFACHGGKLDVVKLLMQFGADPKIPNDDNVAPIELVMFGANPDEALAVMLVDADGGVDPNYTLVATGSTIIHAAASIKQWLALFSACLRRGGDPLIECKSGTLLSCTIAQNDQRDFLAALRSARPQDCATILNARQTRQDTWPLFHSCLRRNHAMTALLLECGADPNLTATDNGRSCLHVSVLEGDLYTCRLLVRHGADVSATSKDRLSRPLDFAIHKKNKDIAAFLVECGADPYLKIEAEVAGSPQSIMFCDDTMKAAVLAALQRRLTGTTQSGSEEGAAGTALGGGGRRASPEELPPAPAAPVVPARGGTATSSSSVSHASSRADPPRPPSAVRPAAGRDDRSSLDSRASHPLNNTSSSGEAAQAEDVPSAGDGRSRLKALREKFEKKKPQTAAEERGVDKGISGSASGAHKTAPPAAQASAPPAAAAPLDCIICMTNPRDATLVHDNTGIGHTCCCMDCARELKDRGDRCPICREPISLVIRNITS